MTPQLIDAAEPIAAFPGDTEAGNGCAIALLGDPDTRTTTLLEADAVAGPADPPGVGGVVSRPELFKLLHMAARVTVVSAPAGSGKTVLLRSWIGAAGLERRAAWVSVGRDERDPQRFWLSVLGALRQTAPGSRLVRELTAAPDLDGWAMARRLLKDLARLEEPVWLVVDDLHELGSAEALRQLELLLIQAPPELRFVFATRHDPRLGLHRLRLEGELTEIRAADLRFSLAEAREMFHAVGVELADSALRMLTERTEGWAAGLRLAALSLSGHPDPERFAAGFCGSERTVADYLLAEVLDRQPAEVRRLLLRTSVLERVNGPLAGVLTGVPNGDRVLQELEEANAFVAPLDAKRSWFRYHRLFADLLQLQLRRTAPDEVAALHERAAQWFADQGFPVEATRHALAAEDWELAVRLIADHWPGMYLDGQAATIHELLAAFPREFRGADAELAALTAADELLQGSLEAAERYVHLAKRGSASGPAGRRGQLQLLLGTVGLLLARQNGDLSAVIEEARRLQAAAEAPEVARPGLGEELRALALVNVGIAEYGTARFEEAESHLEQGVAVARRIGRPFLEFIGLAYQAAIDQGATGHVRSFARAAERSRQAIELAERHGWTDAPAASVAYTALGVVLMVQGLIGDAEPWLQRAERTVRAEAQPAVAVWVHYARGLLELAYHRDAEALAAFRAAERAAGHLASPHYLASAAQARVLEVLARLGELEQAERILAGLDEQQRDRGVMRIAAATLRLAGNDPRGAASVLAPVLDGSAPVVIPAWLSQAFLLEATAQDAIGDPASAARALENGLALAEPDGVVLPFLLFPAPGLLVRHARQGTAHTSLLAEILGRLTGGAPATLHTTAQPLLDPVSKSELRVLRYLPSHLTAQEIAGELYVSANTVKTHMRTLYAKLGAHTRTEAVNRARALSLLA